MKFSLSLRTASASLSLQRFATVALAAGLAGAGLLGTTALAQTAATITKSFAQPETRITAKVDNAQRTTLTGNTHPFTRSLPDLGPVDPSTPMQRMILMLTHSDAQEAALNALLAQQQDKSSPNFHNWLTPTQFGANFGASDADIKTVTDWLTSQGFTVSKVGPGKNYIEFNGTAAQVSTAFQTQIHKFSKDGNTYQANTSDPTIPAALTSVVKGTVSLYNFPPQKHYQSAGTFQRDNKTGIVTRLSGPSKEVLTPEQTKAAEAARAEQSKTPGSPDYTYGTGPTYAVTPWDFAAIYNVTPLWNAGIDGTGQTIAVLEETDIRLNDVRDFRSIFGLPAKDPVIILNGADPGITNTGEEGEAALDTEWAGAVAKGATIDVITTESTAATSGIALSAIYNVDYNIAPIMSLSYGNCEAFLGSTGNAYWAALWQQGDAQGMSIFVSTGDSGSDCDEEGGEYAGYYTTAGLSVSGFATTPYNTAVGGTDLLGTMVSPTTYWNSTNNSTTQASAKGYMPESTWDNNCTNPLYQTSTFGSTYNNYATAGASCKFWSSYISYGALAPVGGAGGESTYSTKPSWQSGTGVPADGHRDIPDVSLMAANGSVLAFNNSGSGAYYGSYYIECEQDGTSGSSCSLSSPTTTFIGIGGTSVSTPAFAGIIAMVNQNTGSKQGLVNYVLYDLFNQQTAAGTGCASSYTLSGSGPYTVGAAKIPAASCVFNDITWGANSVGCYTGSTYVTGSKCVASSGSYGVLTTGTTSVPASTEGYLNTTGYDMATGLGSVNAYNLVNNWANVTFAPTTTSLSIASTTFAHGTPEYAQITVTPVSGSTQSPTGLVQLDTNTTPVALGPATLGTGGTVTQSYSDYPGGTYNVTAYYAGDGTYASSTSSPVSITVTPENSTVTGSTYTYSYSTYAYTAATTSTYGGDVLVNETVAGASGHGTPTGTVTILNNSSPYGTQTLDSAGVAGYSTSSLPAGSYSFTANYAGDASFNSSSTTAAKAITIAKSAISLTFTKGTVTTAGLPNKFTATLVGNNSTAIGNFGSVGPTGTVSIYETGTSGGTSGGTLMGTIQINTFTSTENTTYDLYTITSTGAAELVPPYSTTGTTKEYYYAVYSGDTNYSAATTGSTSSLTITQATKTATTNALTSNPTTVSYGNTTVLTASVTPNSGTNYPTTSDTVSFYVDGVISGSAVNMANAGSSGVPSVATSAAIPTSVLTGGTHTMTAAYSGNTNLLPATSSVLTYTVTPATTAVTLTTASSSPVLQGTAVTYSSTIPYTTGLVAPTGTVTYSVDGTVVSTPAVTSLYSGGVGTSFSTSALAAGTHTITAVYSGDKNYATSTNSASITVNAPSNLMTLTLSTPGSTNIVLGAPVTVNVTATPLNGGPTPTGTVSYGFVGGTAVSGLALTSGATSFTLSGLSILRHVVTVTYSGDSNYASTSSTLVFNGGYAQTIFFPALPNTTKSVAPTVSLAARSTSGLPVTYTVSGPATLSGSILTITGTGTITVTAAQAGNSSFNAATSVVQSFTAN
jgi:subtilase family serine protease